MLDGLGDVDWDSLRHHRGHAGDLPALLVAAATSTGAADSLRDRLCLNEFDVCGAAVAAWPFLLELVTREETPEREWILEAICGCVAEAGASGGYDVHPGWAPVWEAGKPALLALLSTDLRRTALFVLGQGRGDSSPVLPALSARWEAETDPATRLMVVGTAVEFAGHGDEAAREWLAALPVGEDEPEARMLVSAATVPDAAVIVRGLTGNLSLFLESYEMNYVEVLHQLRWLLRDDAAALTEVWLELLGHHSWRTEALDGLLAAVRSWRSVEPRVRPLLGGWLVDPDPRLRHFAVEVVGGLRAAEYADLVADLVSDGAEISVRHRIGDVASWALARCGLSPEPAYRPPEPPGFRSYDSASLSLDDVFPPKRMRAWYEHWRRTGQVGELEQLALGEVAKWRGAALGEDAVMAVRYLAELGVRVPRCEEMLASDHRLAGSASWRAFDEDAEIRNLLASGVLGG